jgi:hypothetical protein
LNKGNAKDTAPNLWFVLRVPPSVLLNDLIHVLPTVIPSALLSAFVFRFSPVAIFPFYTSFTMFF